MEQHWAYVYLYDHYAAMLLGLLIRMVQDVQQAEDLLQDSFIKVYKSISLYDASKARFSTWLLRLTRNTALDYIRSNSLYQVCSMDQQHENQITLVTSEYRHDSLELLVHTCLKEKYQLVISFVYFKGYTQQETADYLQIPVNTVKTRIRKGLQLLKKAYIG